MDRLDRLERTAGIDRRSLLRAGLWLAGGVSLAGVVSACSSGVESPEAASGSGSGTGSPTTSQPTDKFVRSDNAAAKSPLAAQLGLCMVQVEGAIKQFADAAQSEAHQLNPDSSVSINASNSAKAIAQMNSLLQRNAGIMFVQDLDPAADDDQPVRDRQAACPGHVGLH